MAILADAQAAMTWFLVCGAVLCGWAMLRTMGGERERRLREADAAASPTAASAQTSASSPAPAPSKPAAPVKVSAGKKRPSRQAA